MSIRSALHAAPFLALDEGRTATRGFVGTVPMAGAFVTPSIRLDKPLARGGMGSVWRAEHQVLDAPVAVKFMSDGFLSNPEALERFRREAAALACIKSPHVVQVFDFGVTRGGLPYIVMELLEGETLQDRIERYGRLPARRGCATADCGRGTGSEPRARSRRSPRRRRARRLPRGELPAPRTRRAMRLRQRRAGGAPDAPDRAAPPLDQPSLAGLAYPMGYMERDMAHTSKNKDKLLNRARRIRGQLDAVAAGSRTKMNAPGFCRRWSPVVAY